MSPQKRDEQLLESTDSFVRRHIGPRPEDAGEMLKELNLAGMDELIEKTVPASIRLQRPLAAGEAHSEYSVLNQLRELASKNKILRSFIGMGYHDCITPPVIQRNVLENPGWYTHYTPYQAEISQGRLEALLNFQTLIADLTALEIANSSLLDEGTAAAEAMSMSHGLCRNGAFFVSESCHPQTIEVVRTRASARGIELLVGNHESFDFSQPVFGALLQYPASEGAVCDYSEFVKRAHESGALVTVAADLLSLALLRPPESSARTSRWEIRSGWVCRWDTADPRRLFLPRARFTKDRCRGALSAFPKISVESRRSAWRSKQGSNTSVATRPPATSAPLKCCSGLWQACMPCIMGRKG